jgi:primosomal protein N' (replication factor Y)
MDADTTAKKGAHEHLLDAFRNGDYDILVGTQMIAKGLDFPTVTLVGVILAETSLNLPDFRAGERTFNLLTQVAGRSGRSHRGGEVVFQTYQPDHECILAAQQHDYDAFCGEELITRELLGYPPYTHALRLLLRGTDESSVIAAAHALNDALVERKRDDSTRFGRVVIKGPAQAPLSRIRGQHRWHFLLCDAQPDVLRELVTHALADAPPTVTRGAVTVIADMDPMAVL